MTTASAAPLTRGHKKKERTRRLLLDTALDVLAADGEGFTVADIATRAGVSHGTFYNYFADRDALVDALVPELVESFAARSALEVDDADPAARFAIITALGLANAVRNPEIVRVMLRLEAAQRALLGGTGFAHLRQDLADGYAAGRFDGPPDDGTLDVVIGALVLAARRIVDGQHSANYRRTVVSRLLRSLGVDAGEAAVLAKRAVGAAR